MLLCIVSPNELPQIVQKVKDFTGDGQVNIVGHSKGGLEFIN